MVKIYVVIYLVANCFVMTKASAEFNVRGRIVIKDSIYYLKLENKKTDHLIIAVDDIVQSNLKCLKEGDYLSGTANLINGTHIALKSVEHVGLQKLLANWRNDREVFNFSDFKTFYYWQFSKKIFEKYKIRNVRFEQLSRTSNISKQSKREVKEETAKTQTVSRETNRFRGPFPYHYILSPNDNNFESCSWKMFITNETEVVFAILKWISNKQIRIDIYDSNNGEILMTKHLIQTSF